MNVWIRTQEELPAIPHSFLWTKSQRLRSSVSFLEEEEDLHSDAIGLQHRRRCGLETPQDRSRKISSSRGGVASALKLQSALRPVVLRLVLSRSVFAVTQLLLHLYEVDESEGAAWGRRSAGDVKQKPKCRSTTSVLQSSPRKRLEGFFHLKEAGLGWREAPFPRTEDGPWREGPCFRLLQLLVEYFPSETHSVELESISSDEPHFSSLPLNVGPLSFTFPTFLKPTNGPAVSEVSRDVAKYSVRVSCWREMGAHALGFLLIFLLERARVEAGNMEPIYWNSLNRRYVIVPQEP
ncbi:hypothetical protein MHYP_G00183200 [Metynnis hypsauchen]